MTTPPLDAGFFIPPAERGQFTRFAADGFAHDVAGVVYPGATLTSGVPLGGLGTGYVELRGDGTLGGCTVANAFLRPHTLDRPLLAVALDDTVRVLASAGAPAEVCAREVLYWGHYPAADLQVTLDLPVDVGVRLLAPFVPGDAAASNVPAVLIEARLRNRGERPLVARLAAVWPGTPDGAGGPPTAQVVREEWGDGVAVTDARGAGCALIAVGAPGSVVVGRALGTPDTPWQTLAHGLSALVAGEPGMTVAADVTLAPGELTVLRFVLAWYHPLFRDSDQKPHHHHYARRFGSALAVASDVASAFGVVQRRSLAWQEVLYTAEDLPLWLQDALINGLYSLAKNTFWLYSPRPDDWWGETGLFAHSESFTGCPITETTVCRFHGHFPLLFLFPDLELATLRAFAHYQIRSGEIPFCFGQPTGVDRPHYYCQHPLNSAQYIQLVYRYVLRTGDEAALAELYPTVRAALEFMQTLDIDDDGLVDEHPHAPPGENFPANQFYDIWPWYGVSAYVGGIWLATLEAAEVLAARRADSEFAAVCRSLLQRGQQAYEQKLWTGAYYRLYSALEAGRRSETSLANQLMAVWCAAVVGLPSPLPPGNVVAALDTVRHLNYAATSCGVINGCRPDGTPDVAGGTAAGGGSFGADVFVGEALCVAMTYLYQGQRELGLEIARRVIECLFVRHPSPWNQHCLISGRDGAPSWGSDYYSNLVIWALPMALAGQDIATFAASGGLLDRLLTARARG